MVMTVDCPHCGKPVAWAPDSRWRPFCSERCRLIDLGDWLEERHRLPADDEASSEDAPGSTEAPVRH
jgi:uncharacterized protein